MSLVVVDTDVASTLLRRRAPATLAGQLADHTIAITFVTYGELCRLPGVLGTSRALADRRDRAASGQFADDVPRPSWAQIPW